MKAAPHCQCRIVSGNTADPERNIHCRETATRLKDIRGQRVPVCATHFRESFTIDDGQVAEVFSRVKPKS